MYKMVLVLPVTLIFGVTFLVKLVDIICKSKLAKFQEKESQVEIDFVSTKVSYEQFTEIAKESLCINDPIRQQDFLNLDQNKKDNIRTQRCLD